MASWDQGFFSIQFIDRNFFIPRKDSPNDLNSFAKIYVSEIVSRTIKQKISADNSSTLRCLHFSILGFVLFAQNISIDFLISNANLECRNRNRGAMWFLARQTSEI